MLRDGLRLFEHLDFIERLDAVVHELHIHESFGVIQRVVGLDSCLETTQLHMFDSGQDYLMRHLTFGIVSRLQVFVANGHVRQTVPHISTINRFLPCVRSSRLLSAPLR